MNLDSPRQDEKMGRPVVEEGLPVRKFVRMSIPAAIAIVSLSGLPSAATRDEIPSRSFEFRYVVHVSAMPRESHELRLWVPLPYEDSDQSISGLRIEAPTQHEVQREPEYKDRYAYFVFDAAHLKNPFDVELTFHVKRLEHRAPLLAVADPPPPHAMPVEIAHFLQPDRLVPIDGQIAELSRKQTAGAREPLEKSRKIYDYVIATMHYDHDGSGWGRGDAVWACNAKHGNCTDFHSLFIAMARAAGIPARFEIGFPLPANAHEGAISGYHCWAEFYIDRLGWIPIDASEAWKDPSKKEYFFGTTDANRVMFSLGRDIRLNPPQSGDPLNYFVYPYAELDDQPFTAFKNEFSFRDDAAAARTTAAAATP
jgi:transglutaminase-like putative cysteine protease